MGDRVQEIIDVWKKIERLRVENARLTAPSEAFIDAVARRRHDAEQYAKAPKWSDLPESQRDLWRDSVRKTSAAAATTGDDDGPA